MKYGIKEINGFIVGSVSSESGLIPEDYIEIDTPISDEIVSNDTFYRLVENSVIDTQISKKAPSEFHQFDYVQGTWIDTRDLKQQKIDKWENIKQERELRRYAPITHDGNEYDANLESQLNMQGALQLVNINPTIELTWTLANNSNIVLDATKLQALAVTIGIRTNTIYEIARNLREQIDACTTEQQLSIIAWPE